MAGNFAPSRANIVQFGRQASLSASATPTAASIIWRGEGLTDIHDDRRRMRVKENVGRGGNTDRLYDASLFAKIGLARTPFSFTQGPHVFEMAHSAATPGNAGSHYKRSYALPRDNSTPTPKFTSVEAGNTYVSGDTHVMPGGYCEEYTLEGASGQSAGEAWMISASLAGQKKTIQVLTSPLALVTPEDAVFNNTLFYIDDSGGTIGTTLVSDVMLKTTIKVKTGLTPNPGTHGTLFFDKVEYQSPDDQVLIDLVYELEDSSLVVAERAKYVSKAVRLLKWHTPGSGAGQDLVIRAAVRYLDFQSYTNSSGNVVVVAKAYAVISDTDSEYYSLDVLNDIADLAAA